MLTKVLFILSLLGCILVPVLAHRCYVCGPLQMGFQRSCDQFNSLTQQEFIEACNDEEPIKGTYGCSAQFTDSTIVRECAVIRMNDCKVANNVKYCYCAKDLCNNVNFDDDMEMDDEDMAEGSGFIEEKEYEVTERITTTSTANTFYGTVTLVMVSMLLR